jgi:hypothetical protein
VKNYFEYSKFFMLERHVLLWMNFYLCNLSVKINSHRKEMNHIFYFKKPKQMFWFHFYFLSWFLSIQNTFKCCLCVNQIEIKFNIERIKIIFKVSMEIFTLFFCIKSKFKIILTSVLLLSGSFKKAKKCYKSLFSSQL